MNTSATSPMRLARRILAIVFRSRIIAFVAGVDATVVLEGWIKSDWKSALFASAALVVGVAVYGMLRMRDENRSRSVESASARRIMRPDPEAELLAYQSHERRVVVGSVVEMFTRRNLASEVTLDEKGWSPSAVAFKRTSSRPSFDRILEESGGCDQSLSPPNGRKFGVAKFSAITNDSDEEPEFTFYETDYFTQMSVYRVLPHNSQLRKTFGSLDPASNLIPNSISLQSVVLFPNHEILCMLRRTGVDAEGGRWSVSFEEQLKDIDFEQMPICNPPEFLFRRAFVEEVFGCKSDNIVHVREAWQSIEEDHVLASYRLWGLFYEVPVAHFQLLGFYRLNLTPADLDRAHSLAKARGWGGVDPEGKLFVLERREWERLLVSGYGNATGLYDVSKRNQELVRVEDLHRTSLYRLWRLANLLGYAAPSSFDRHFTTLNLDT